MEEGDIESISFFRLIYLICIALCVVVPIRLWVVQPIYIPTASMEPALFEGIYVFEDSLSLRFRSLRRGDIIGFKSPVGEVHDLVKRVIALPGDTIELREKKVYINGKLKVEKYAQYKRKDERLTGDNFGPATVPEDHIFVLGDNRDESLDSSYWVHPDTGERVVWVPIKDVKGIIRGMFWSE